jgi:uncharacterized membrane protein YidH (DUF202 family)
MESMCSMWTVIETGRLTTPVRMEKLGLWIILTSLNISITAKCKYERSRKNVDRRAVKTPLNVARRKKLLETNTV